ncbi:hypothetical protein INR49_016684 [Caranx melampygus]|nr:hypothetical protein INR49_016684 [Caranx melampygus]
MAFLAEDDNTSKLPLRSPTKKSAIFAVLISVTYPLLDQTLLALDAAVFGGANWGLGAALLIRVVPAIWVTITTHCGRHTLATGAFKLSGTAVLISCGMEIKLYHNTGALMISEYELPSSGQPTTVGLIAAIPTVHLTITDEALRDTAGLVITLMITVLQVLDTSQFVRAVLTLRHTVSISFE